MRGDVADSVLARWLAGVRAQPVVSPPVILSPSPISHWSSRAYAEGVGWGLDHLALTWFVEHWARSSTRSRCGPGGPCKRM